MTASYNIGEVKGVGSGRAASNPLNLIILIIVIQSETKCTEESFNTDFHLPYNAELLFRNYHSRISFLNSLIITFLHFLIP